VLAGTDTTQNQLAVFLHVLCDKVQQPAHAGMKDRIRPALHPISSRRKRHLNGVLICRAVVAVEIQERREEVRHG
jgi:hypothetical protein